MSYQSIFCISDSRFQANHIVDRLKIAEIPEDGISTLLADHTATDEFASRADLSAVIAGASKGNVPGAAWGWIASIGAMAIPGAGLFLAGGPIIAAMSGATRGATFGSICGGLIGLGVPEIEAKRYEGKILEGKILLCVNHCDSAVLDKVIDVFDQAAATYICSIESSKPPRKLHLPLAPPPSTLPQLPC